MPSSVASSTASGSQGASTTRTVRRDIHCTATRPSARRPTTTSRPAAQIVTSTIVSEMRGIEIAGRGHLLRGCRRNWCSSPGVRRCVRRSFAARQRRSVRDRRDNPDSLVSLVGHRRRRVIRERDDRQLPTRQRHGQDRKDERARECQGPDQMADRGRGAPEHDGGQTRQAEDEA